MNTRYQTTTAGRTILQPASNVIFDHVTTAINSARAGTRAWIKARSGETDDRLWCIEFVPNPDDEHRPAIVVWAWTRQVQFGTPGNPEWVEDVKRVLDRICSVSPGGTS